MMLPSAENNKKDFATLDSAAAKEDSSLKAILNIPQIAALPDYYKQFIVSQNYASYTAVDHAVWRYFMRQNINFLVKHAHEIYFEGLERTGLEIEKIPSIEGMNKILSKIGWAAVTVNGFIPPAAFMAFQAYRILVIAADMRQIEHIEYTPSPDIIHEAAGHAPVIADAEYAEYLRLFGEIGSKAMSSKADFELYEAIRLLSILKETPGTEQSKIDEAEKDVLYKQEHLGKPSEMALLSRLHWWTVEYGLIGSLDNCKIYGAGLLSSLGESSRCLTPAVKKLPYDINAANFAFDITTEQPQLFVTPDFTHLIKVLKEFSETMAYKIGGRTGLKRAVECKRTSTAKYSSGLQVTGEFVEFLADDDNNPIYLRTAGPTALACDNVQLEGHSKDYHRDGFSSPIGRLSSSKKPIEQMTDTELETFGIIAGQKVKLEFENGIVVKGILDNIEKRNNSVVLLTFNSCTATFGERILFDPEWGIYDMAVGEKIDSVHAGAADKDAYEDVTMVSRTRTVKAVYSEQQKALHQLYKRIRDFREGREQNYILPETWQTLKSDHPKDWLLSLELLELMTIKKIHPETAKEIKLFLEKRAETDSHYAKVITDGLKLIAWEVPDYSRP